MEQSFFPSLTRKISCMIGNCLHLASRGSGRKEQQGETVAGETSNKERAWGSRSVSNARVNMTWLETLPPLAIIGAMLVVAGSSQNLIHKLINGKPKHPGADLWDKAMDSRDARLREELEHVQKQ